ncbi:hypothetical protein DPEC_G00331310 [Dallia pectoralis]|uniref:Uncharacterized protein n=1 Tax=Dallia pectoralis TaxID=75939 RepID=A0ACC2F907_DALPE|nr:hypothetical protein DPEC_G00331310 [Dallia pectoralis]
MQQNVRKLNSVKIHHKDTFTKTGNNRPESHDILFFHYQKSRAFQTSFCRINPDTLPSTTAGHLFIPMYKPQSFHDVAY